MVCLRIQTDENLLSRFGFMKTAPDPTTDPVSGKALLEHVVYLRLNNPSGRPVPLERRFRAAPTQEPVLAPASAATCARQLQEFESRLERLRPEVEALRSPFERFGAAAPNPSLEREIVAEAARLDTEGVVSRAECRGEICKLSVPGVDAMEQLFRRISRDRLRTRIDWLASSNDYVMFRVSPTERADGAAILKQRIAELRASGDLEACHHQTPMSGALKVRFLLPGTGHENADGVKNRISARYGGTLGWTGLRRCAEAAIERHVLDGPLPEPVQGLWTYETFEFDRSLVASPVHRFREPERGPVDTR